MAGLQRPPIPQAPLVDPATGHVTREWWRWFSLIGVEVTATAGDVTTITLELPGIVEIGQTAALLADTIDKADLVRQTLLLQRPQDALPLDQLALAPQL